MKTLLIQFKNDVDDLLILKNGNVTSKDFNKYQKVRVDVLGNLDGLCDLKLKDGSILYGLDFSCVDVLEEQTEMFE